VSAAAPVLEQQSSQIKYKTIPIGNEAEKRTKTDREEKRENEV
jgi:hypothetical protein